MSASPIGSIYPDLPGFAKENRELVNAMCEYGWTGRVTSKGHWLGKAPDGTTTLTVPAKNGNNRGLKNAHAVFMRWVKAQMPDDVRDAWDIAKQDPDPIIADVMANGVVKHTAQKAFQDNMQRAHEEFIEMVKKDPRVTIEPLIRPWLARKQPGKDGGTRYESQAVLERVWPTGETDYECALPGCNYVSRQPVSVARHYGAAHTRKGVTPATEGAHHPDPEYTEPTQTRDYRPTQRLVDALASFLAEHSWDNTDELAVLMLTWANDRPDIEHTERPLVPLTDKDVLNRIRMLVGQPDQSDRIEELEETVRVLSVEVARLKDEKAALRDLLTDD